MLVKGPQVVDMYDTGGDTYWRSLKAISVHNVLNQHLINLYMYWEDYKHLVPCTFLQHRRFIRFLGLRFLSFIEDRESNGISSEVRGCVIYHESFNSRHLLGAIKSSIRFGQIEIPLCLHATWKEYFHLVLFSHTVFSVFTLVEWFT